MSFLWPATSADSHLVSHCFLSKLWPSQRHTKTGEQELEFIWLVFTIQTEYLLESSASPPTTQKPTWASNIHLQDQTSWDLSALPSHTSKYWVTKWLVEKWTAANLDNSNNSLWRIRNKQGFVTYAVRLVRQVLLLPFKNKKIELPKD